MKTYRQKLLDPRWQRRRLEMLEASKWECQRCGDKESTLHVHHKRYIKGAEPWDYTVGDLVVLCDLCHEEQHRRKEVLDQLLAGLIIGANDVGDMAALLAGYISGSNVPNTIAQDVIEDAMQLCPLIFERGYLAAQAADLGISGVLDAQRAMKKVVADIMERPRNAL